MARFARIVVPGWVHRVTQRGNRRQIVLFEDHDRLIYLQLLAKCLASHDITLIGCCLMSNHVHLAVTPGVEEALALGRPLLPRRRGRKPGTVRDLFELGKELPVAE